MQVPLLTLPQAVPSQKMRSPQDTIPQTRAERDYVARVIREYVAKYNPVPPMPLEQLKVHAEKIIEVSGLDPKFRDYCAILINNEAWREQLATNDNALIRDNAGRVFGAIQSSGLAIFPASVALNIVQGLGGSLVTVFTLFLVAFYWITERTVIKRAVVGLFRPSQHGRAATLWNEVEAKLGAWIRGQLLLMAVIGSLATIAYGLMGLPFWLILGVIAGLTEAIPNVGPVLGAIPAVLIAVTVSWKWALAVVAFVIVLQLVENAVLVPRIMKGAVGLTPLTTILAILAGAEFRGVVGALLAVPVAGALQVILGDLVREKQEREAAEEEEQRFGYRLRRALQRRRAPAAPGD